ncbi:MAG: phytanoyl-CoA dioxygenase family protein [Gammaproteobacteria bacterium]|nr:phytanoyl-CoA dioxygenase family protein [Gammaproteobacteria bacterium]
MISAQQVNAYRDNGYLVVENAIEPTLLERLRKATAEFIERSREVSVSDSIYDIGLGHSPDRPVVRRLKNPHQQHCVYDQAMRSPRLVSIVKALLGTDVRFDHSKLNFKPLGGDAAVEWHQDWAFYPHTNDDILAVGVMLQDCDLENGPLMVIPGSHKGPIYDHHHNGYFVGALDPNDADAVIGNAVALTGKAGSASFHHVRTIHGSAENRSCGDRPILLFSYAAVDAWPLVDVYDWDEFNSRILTGDVTWAPRQKPLPIRIPLPKVPVADSIYDDQASIRGRSFAKISASH